MIVIDDGSTDETPEVLNGYGEPIRAVRRGNGGLVAAVDTGLGLARGEFIALLDADDEWPRDRLARHLAALAAAPEVGLVHGDMELIDAAGATTEPSFFQSKQMRVAEGRILGSLLSGNFITQSACTFRASLLPVLHPIDEAAAYPDWWLATVAAAVSEVRPWPVPRLATASTARTWAWVGRRPTAADPAAGAAVAPLDVRAPAR